jgi:hypothetical protein
MQVKTDHRRAIFVVALRGNQKNIWCANMNYMLTILAIRIVGNAPEGPVDVLAILSHAQTDMLEPCGLIAKAMNAQAEEKKTPLVFQCRHGTFEIDPKTLALKGAAVPVSPGPGSLPIVPPSEQIVATAHLTDSSGKEQLLDMFEVFRIGTLMPQELPMNVCKEFTSVVTSVRYTCAPNTTP